MAARPCPGHLRKLFAFGWALVSASVIAETAALLEIDSRTSTLTTTLCVQGNCSEDTHPISGEIRLELDCGMPPTQAAVRDFRVDTTTNHVAFLNFGFGGKVDAVVRDLAIRRHPSPFLEAPIPLGASNVVFRNLTNDLSGTIDYRASGLACALLQVAGLKCEDRVDLAGRPPNVVAELPAVWSIQDGVLRITGTFSFREDIDTAHPEIGYVGGKVTLTAAGPIRPVLRIQPATDRLEFRWCSSFATARLEAAPNLDAASWQTLSADPETSGTDRTVRIPKPTTATFYRLRTDP